MIDIDRIARHRIDADPAPDLEARILARLAAEPVPARRRRWPVWATAAGVMTAGVMLTVVQVSRRPDVQTPASSLSTSATSTNPGASATLAASDISDISAIADSPSSRAMSAIAPVELSPEEQAWMDRRIPALPALDALSIPAFEYASIQPDALSIAPLSMTPLSTEDVGAARQD